MSLFITFEGPDGSGKSTQSRRLHDRLAAQYTVLLTREPGGTPIGDTIRRIVLDMENSAIDPTAEALLFSAARAQLVAERIRPQLAIGGLVICDRFADSMLAYQGYGSGRDLDQLRALVEIATAGLRPDLTFFLDLPPEAGLERKRRAAHRKRSAGSGSEGDDWNRLDARNLAYHERVRDGFLTLARQEPERWRILDARESKHQLAERIYHDVQQRLTSLRRPR
jgi:dTMP kinase